MGGTTQPYCSSSFKPLRTAMVAGFFGVVFGNRFGVQSPDAEAVLLLSSVLCILSLPLFITLTSGI